MHESIKSAHKERADKKLEIASVEIVHVDICEVQMMLRNASTYTVNMLEWVDNPIRCR